MTNMMTSNMAGRVLIVAGSDSGGGAGVQADIKTVTALNGYAATAITALTAQNTTGVHNIYDVDPAFIADQMRLVLDDIGADCLKTGMLHSRAVIETVASVLADHAPDVPLVVDPVMVAKGGASLLEDEAVSAVVTHLLPRATVLTPNMPEAAALTGLTVETVEDMHLAGKALLEKGAQNVLVKGGHMEGETLTDLLITPDQAFTYTDTRHTHGTGCTLASAIATGIAHGMALPDAVERARTYVRNAILTAPGYGKGHGPLNHAHGRA